jgi:hypothetical protein
VRLLVSSIVLFASLCAQQEPADQKKPDTFFAGTVMEFTASKITVSRVVLGKTEKRTFRLTPETKVEGKLRARARVTVRWATADEGDTATQIVVWASQQKK